MAYVVPTTRADGYVVDASEWNKNTVDNPIALKALIDALPPAISKETVCGRLSLTTATPVTTADVTAATTLYWALYKGNQIALYTGAAWVLSSVAELSIAVPATTNQMYDVFVDYNGGTPQLSLTAWTNDTTRATALTLQDGVLVLTGSTGKRFVGSVRTTGVSGQTEDSYANRLVDNYYHFAPRPVRVTEPANSYNYTTATWRQVNANAANQVGVVICAAGRLVSLEAKHYASNTSASVQVQTGIGEDSTSAPLAGAIGVGDTASLTLQNQGAVTASVDRYPAVGYHYYAFLERSTATGTTTWYGDNSDATLLQAGLRGVVLA